MNLLTACELRQSLKISRTTLYRLIKQGMPSYGKGRLRRFELDTVLRWVNGGRDQVDQNTIWRPGLYRCNRCRKVFTSPRPFHVDFAYCLDCYTRTREWVGRPPKPEASQSTS